jgi:hypothetical protein
MFPLALVQQAEVYAILARHEQQLDQNRHRHKLQLKMLTKSRDQVNKSKC